MTVKVGINGFGRIGRQVFKAIRDNYAGVLDVEAINDLMPAATNAHLLKYDSTYGKFNGEVEVRDNDIYVDGEKLKSYAEKDPANLPWGELGVDIVLECTGRFRGKATAGPHLAAGAKKVIISAPGDKDVDGTFVLGVNEQDYNPATMSVISNASCTTNALAPVAKVLHENFGIKRALMTTIHAMTNDQSILDVAHKDLRRARTTANNIIPTSTGAAKAVGLVLPDLMGKFNGMSFRVPTVTVSVVDLVCEFEKSVTKDEINAALKAASVAPGWLGKVLNYSDEPLVSMDLKGDPASTTVDSLLTDVIGGNFAKVVTWYDNEWGYASRLADITAYVAERL